MRPNRARATATDDRMLTALSMERGARQLEQRNLGNVHGPVSSNGHVLVAAGVVLVGVFVTTAGAGSGNLLLAATGVGVAISAVVYGAFTVAQRRLSSTVNGTAHVVNAGAPPAAATHGRCEMHLVVQAPQLAAIAVRHRDQSTPVAKWPTPGASLPVKVDPRDPRNVRILWDQMRPHGQAHAPQDADAFPTSSETPGGVAADRTPTPNRADTKDNPPEDDAAPAAHTALHTTIEPPVLLDLDDDPAPAIGLTRANSVPTSVSGVTEMSGDITPLISGSDDAALDLSFLDAPPQPDTEVDPLLEEYGSPVREVGVTLIVSDIHQSLAFYRDVLGFFEIESGPDMVLLEARTGRVVLRQRLDAHPTSPHLMHLTLEVNDIDAAHRTLTRRGVEFVDEPRAVLKGELLELWAVSFHDPDGHGVALTSWRPREAD